ncbi:MAG: regulatory protein RecX [Chloroherpetonaceae bacterium]|nr:regulatory protein RecX [Chloroherpetonaceae bacterium]
MPFQPHRINHFENIPEKEGYLISSVEAQKKIPNRISIFLDGQFAFSLSIDLTFELGLRKGRRISHNELKLFQSRCEADETKAKAYALLSRRPHSRRELMQKLRLKGFPADVIDEVISEFSKKQLLLDEEVAEQWVESKLRSKNIGPSKIKAFLYKKGITKEIIEKTLNDKDLQEDEKCFKAAKAKWKSMKETDRKKKEIKLGRFLQGQGFSWDSVRKAIKAVNEPS